MSGADISKNSNALFTKQMFDFSCSKLINCTGGHYVSFLNATPSNVYYTIHPLVIS